MVIALPSPDGDGAFSPKAWVNAALRYGGDEGSADMHLSVLITKLQIAASEVDADIQQVTAGLSTVTPKLAREIGALREQASAVRADLEGLMHEAAAASERSEAAVIVMRDTLAAQRRLAAVSDTV